jgi:hypothetical protein
VGVGSRWCLTLFAGAWFAATAGAAWAQGAGLAGRFLSVVGDVRIVGRDGTRRAAEPTTEFREGETIVTGAAALAQLRMSDGSLVSVRSDTEMKLDRFAYAGENDRSASFLMSVVKGGFRTITGLIGRANRQGYRITTASATIGIRGTHFEVVHVQQAASKDVPTGTYNRVFDGITSMQNKAGVTLLVSRDQTAFVALSGTVPPVLIPPPPALFGRPTPIPGAKPQSLREGDGKADKARVAPGAQRVSPATVSPSVVSPIQTAPALTPIQTAPPPVSPVPIAPTTPISPVLTAPTTAVSPVLTAPTTTLAPVLTAPTTIVSPVLTAPVLTPLR